MAFFVFGLLGKENLKKFLKIILKIFD